MRGWFDRNTKYLFSLPTVIFVVVCIAYPLGYALNMSFNNWSMSSVAPPQWVGLDNYRDLFREPRVLNAIGFTFKYFFVAIFVETLLGLILALLLNKIRHSQGLIRTAFIFPMVATPIAMGYVWKMIYDPSLGLINSALRYFHLPTSTWLGSVSTVFPSLMIMEVWHGVPLIMLILLAGLTAIGTDIFESARIDGAGEWRTMLHITVPLLVPTITMAVLLRGIDVLKTFDIIYATTAGGPSYASENLNILVYTYAFDFFKMGDASALMIIFFAIVLAFALICMQLKKIIERRYDA